MFYNFYLLMYFWLHWVFVAASRLLSSCGEQRQHPNCGVWSSHCNGSSCCRACAPGHADFSSCESQALDRGLGNRGAWLSCFEASGISLGQNGTYVPCIGRWIFFFLNTGPPGRSHFIIFVASVNWIFLHSTFRLFTVSVIETLLIFVYLPWNLAELMY